MTMPDLQNNELAEVYMMSAEAAPENTQRIVEDMLKARKPSQGTPANDR